jgi:cell division septal protein FtsQ
VKSSAPRARAGRKTRDQHKKQRNRRKPNYKLLFSLFCVSAALGCAASYALQTPDLIIKEVEIRGIHCADKAQVRQAARNVLGQNIILLQKSPVIARIRAVNEVQSVKMGRTLPAKVWVKIKERKAEAVLARGGKYFLLQDDGLAFHVTNRPEAGLPVIDAADCGRVSEGTRCSSPGVQCALKIVEFARERRLKVAKISVDRLGDICLNMGSGFYAKLGQPDEIAKKMTLLRKALAFKPSLARDAAYIDLSCPSAPVWKPKMGAGSAS